MDLSVAAILDRIDSHQFFVPAFQREYVWKKENAKELMDTLIKGYPFGTMLTWETLDPPKLKGNFEYNERLGAVHIILDGQQRITTLYLLVRGKIPPYYSSDDINDDVTELYVNVKSLELSYKKSSIMDKDPFWIQLTSIFKKETNVFRIKASYEEANSTELATEDLENINDNIKKIENILDRKFPQQIIPVHATTNEAIDIFYKVNDGGIKLTDAELALAQISGYWPDARDIFKQKLETLKKNGFVLRLDHIIYMLLGCVYFMASDMKKLHSPSNEAKIKEVWKELDETIIDYVFNILRSRAFIDHSNEINGIYAIIPMILHRYLKKSDWDEIEIKKITKWFYYSQLRQRYVHQFQQKLDYDLKIIKESSQPFDDLLSVISQDSRLEISPEEFERRNIRHPLWNLMKCYFKSKKAICLTTGVSIQKNMGSKYQLEWDHIFAWSKLRLMGYNVENVSKYQLAQEITNRAIITQLANRRKSDQPAITYLEAVKERFPNALSLQVIPEDKNLWAIENYELFLQKRREMLAEELNAFLTNITETESVRETYSIEDIISNGETEDTEFKQTFRYNIFKAEYDRSREDDIIKCIAAFGNSETGGDLFIGVSDDGEVLGLEDDFQNLRKNGPVDKDGFELLLRECISGAFGEVFTATKIDISFPKIEGKEICLVSVRPVSTPKDLLIVKKNKNGQEQQIIYLRSGNSSRTIPPEEYSSFIETRF